MRILRLRTRAGVPALKGENNWSADDKDTALRMIPCGHFVVSKYGKHVLVPGASVAAADVEPDTEHVVGDAQEKRGPGRPKKEPVQG